MFEIYIISGQIQYTCGSQRRFRRRKILLIKSIWNVLLVAPPISSFSNHSLQILWTLTNGLSPYWCTPLSVVTMDLSGPAITRWQHKLLVLLFVLLFHFWQSWTDLGMPQLSGVLCRSVTFLCSSCRFLCHLCTTHVSLVLYLQNTPLDYY